MRNVPQSDWPTFVTQPCIPHNHNVIHYILWWITCITKYSSPINWRFSVYFKFAKKNFLNFINFIIFNWINWNWNFQFKFPCWNLKYQKVKKLDSFSSDWSMKSNFHQKPNIPTKSSIFSQIYYWDWMAVLSNLYTYWNFIGNIIVNLGNIIVICTKNAL